MKLVVTYCSGPKRRDSGGLPAVERYESERIRRLAGEHGAFFFILSGEFALLAADEYIPWYDHLLQADEVQELAITVADQLLEYEPSEVEYHTADPEKYPQVAPYHRVISTACRFAGVPLEIVILDGNPD